MSHNVKIALVISGILIIVFATFQHIYAEAVTITEDNILVRNGPGTEYETIGSVNEGDAFQIIEKTDNWIKINFQGDTGWIAAAYTSDSSTSEEQAENQETEQIQLLYDQTRIRAQPTTDSDVLASESKGTTFSVTGEDGDWIKIDYHGQQAYVASWLTTDTSNYTNDEPGIRDKTIVIDAGHGGRDVGAIGASGTYEKDAALKTALMLRNQLEALGANVVLTREEDTFLSLEARASMANAAGADVVLSLHYNSAVPYPDASGIASYYYGDHHQLLAELLQEKLTAHTEKRDRQAAQGDFHMVREVREPAVLLELGFLSNPEEEELIFTEAYQEKLTAGIIEGLTLYFQ